MIAAAICGKNNIALLFLPKLLAINSQLLLVGIIRSFVHQLGKKWWVFMRISVQEGKIRGFVHQLGKEWWVFLRISVQEGTIRSFINI